jgi:cell division septation protein DedD
MLLLLNGATGGWDELAIALVALGVLWLAVKLAGRKRAGQDDDDPALDEQALEEDHKHPAHPPATPPD